MWFPYRRAVTHSFAEFVQNCIAEFNLQRCLYIGFESPSVIDTLQQSRLAALHTSSSFDYWHTEADWWGDQPTACKISRRAFMQPKVMRVIEGDPDGIDFLYIDRAFDAVHLERFQAVLDGNSPRKQITPRFVILTDLQESDGPSQASTIALKQGWFRVRVADSYIPECEDRRPETFVSHVFVPEFSHGSAVIAFARKHHLSIDTNQSTPST